MPDSCVPDSCVQKVIPKALKHILKSSDDKTISSLRRMVNVWEERRVFGSSSKLPDEFKTIFAGVKVRTHPEARKRLRCQHCSLTTTKAQVPGWHPCSTTGPGPTGCVQFQIRG